MSLRNTKQKALVLNLATAHHDHPTADQIYLEARQVDEKISRGTVYRNLNQLAAVGMLMHVKVPSADRFDCRLDPHYHLFCTQCGAVFDAPMPYQKEWDQLVAQKTGFQVDRHRTIYEGRCSACLHGADGHKDLTGESNPICQEQGH